MTGQGLQPLDFTEKEKLTMTSGSELQERYIMFRLLCIPLGLCRTRTPGSFPTV